MAVIVTGMRDLSIFCIEILTELQHGFLSPETSAFSSPPVKVCASQEATPGISLVPA